MRTVDRKEQRLECPSKYGLFAWRHRANSIAMVGMMKRDEFLPSRISPVLPVLIRHLHGDLDGGGSIVGIENPPQTCGEHSQQPFRQLNGRFVRASREHDVLQ